MSTKGPVQDPSKWKPHAASTRGSSQVAKKTSASFRSFVRRGEFKKPGQLMSWSTISGEPNVVYLGLATAGQISEATLGWKAQTQLAKPRLPTTHKRHAWTLAHFLKNRGLQELSGKRSPPYPSWTSSEAVVKHPRHVEPQLP